MSAPSTRTAGAPPPKSTLKARLLRTDRRLLGLVLLLPVLVAVWVPLLRGKPTPKPAAAIAGQPNEAAAASIPAAPLAEPRMPLALPAGSPAAVSQLGQQVAAALTPYEPRWQEPRKAAAITVDTPEPSRPPTDRASTAPPTELVPSAILLSPGARPMAIVGGVPRMVGDTIGAHTVLAIEERCVRYRRGAEDISVNLPPPASRGPQ